jgi:hypothetical protein
MTPAIESNQNFMKTPFHFTMNSNLIPLAMLLLTAAVSAQVIQIVPLQPPPAAPEAPPEQKPAVEVKPEVPDLAKALSEMKFDRSPEALLAATRAQRKDGGLSPEEAFKMSVMFGDWPAVGKVLATLPPADALACYSRLLDTLGEQSIPVGAVLKTPEPDSEDEHPSERMNRLQNERNQLKTKSAPLLSEDFYGLIDAAPADLREENIVALTKLAKTALGEGGRGTLLAKLKTGWKGLGGSTPEGRKLATHLLSSLGWIKDAAPFLPLKNEEWENADTTQLVFAMEYFTQTGIADRDERQLQRAAELCAWLMKTARFGNYTRPQFRLAMDRLVQLLPALEPAEAQKLIREQLFKQTATLSDLISVIGELGQTAAKGNALPARAASLGTQHLILEALVAKQDQLPPNTAVLVMNWLTEAEGCYRAGGVVATEMSQAERMMMRRYGMSRQGEITTLSTEQILATAPPLELIARLNAGLAQRVQLTLLKVNILRPDQADLKLLRDYVKAHPGLEREVCQDVLAGWVSKRTKPAESEQVKQMRAYGMYIPPQMQQAGAGIPLTRLRQNQNIQQFKNLLTELRAISPEPLDATLIVQAFMTLHSGAEVYQLEDIMAIFGAPEKMVREELLDLLGGMRARLGEQWRDPKTQQQAGTNRTEQEAKDEVSRGYRTTLELAKRGIRAEDGDWASFITRGQLFYDASQYEFERQVKLTEYVSLRDEAFSSFRKAAELYAAKLPSLPRGQWTTEPYQAWFFVMLGASDLAQLTTNTARTDPGLTSIGDAMRALPGGAGDRHLELFAGMLGELFPRVPANVRQRFLGSGLKIVGENHPAAGAAMTSLNYYRELLDEIQLRVTVDGPTRVGHTQPFGVFIGLEATTQLLRESGGFGKHLKNQSQQQAGMGGQGGGASNLRDNFTKNIHAALDETFEVISITFHDAAVKTIDLPRDGWAETPLIYAVLRAKNAAVDRIPSIQIDMDFVDQPGQVVLPVMSQVQPLDARDATVESRPCGELVLTQTMDEREWREGKLVVEIQARGQGIIPKLEELFDCQRDGFQLEIVDSNLALTQFVSDGKQRLPQADRNWQLTYRRKADLRGDVMFPFPKMRDGIKPASIEYKHYQDADLVTVDAAKAAAGVKLVSQVGNGPRNLALLGLLAAAVVAVVLMARRKKAVQSAVAKELAAPADPTPFTTVAFLRRIKQDHAPHLSDGDQAALKAQIDEIEAGYFSGGNAPSLDLSAIIGKWLGVVRRSS